MNKENNKNKVLGYFEALPKSTQGIVSDTILKVIGKRRGPEGYRLDRDCIQNLECHSRDGFSPYSHNKGGLVYQNFTNLMDYFGSGHTPAHEEAAKEIERQTNQVYESVSQDVYEGHKPLCLKLNIGENEATYHSIREFTKTSESLTEDETEELYEMLREIENLEGERLTNESSSIMHELRFMYHGKESGVHTASVSAALNTEGPYHRTSISWAPSVFCEGSKEVEIKWRNNKELKEKLEKALKLVSKAIF